MAKYINMAELQERVAQYFVDFNTDKYNIYKDVVEVIEDTSIIDIVCCRECKHIDRTICLTSFPEKYRCKLGNNAHRLDFFCSYGERER